MRLTDVTNVQQTMGCLLYSPCMAAYRPPWRTFLPDMLHTSGSLHHMNE